VSTAVDTKFAEVFVVSDGTGETATGAVRAAMSQFQTAWRLRTFGDVRHESQVRRVVQLAQRSGALVVFTVVDKRVAEKIRNLSAELGVPVVDVLGPLIANVAQHLHVEPKLKPGLLHGFSDQYFRRIEAVEFAVRHDDGMNMHTLFEADLVLTGPSRTSKTPLSMYLAQRGYKTGNVPLIPAIEPPRELCEMDPRKVLGLVLDPASLLTVRQARMRTMGAAPYSAYVDREGVALEIERARRVFRSHGWRTVDTTGRAVEETASRVLELLGVDSVSTR
jgi:[pyruvate, water dikinase]-phosphate phosphotransferase / [pyruvate, water dikinase] kinase